MGQAQGVTSLRVSFVLAAICGLLVRAPDQVVSWLAYDRQAILAGEIWRAWTGHCVHFTWQHAVVDVTVLFVAAAIIEGFKGWRATAFGFLAGAPIISLALLLAVPGLHVYEGASGIATMFGVAAGVCLWRSEPRLRVVVVMLAMGTLIKLLADASDVTPRLTTLPPGILVAWQAHAVGAILGLGFALVAGKWGQTRFISMANFHRGGNGI